VSTVTVWRLTDRNYVASAFDGIGAEKFGGRFNSVGRKMVYCAGSLSLALLEQLVRTNSRDRLRRQVCIQADVDSSLVETASPTMLPKCWSEIPYTSVSQNFGDEWLASQSSAVLKVPSVVLASEWNYLLNPEHPDFATIVTFDAFPVPIDRRVERLLP
jgi:RES domain-containing protein